MFDVSKMNEELRFLWKIGIAKKIIERGRVQGFLTYQDINDFIPGYISSKLLSGIQEMLAAHEIEYGNKDAIKNLFNKVEIEKVAIKNDLKVLKSLDNTEDIKRCEGIKESIFIHEKNINYLKNKIVSSKLTLINEIAKKYSLSSTPLLERKDLFQEGFIGLLKAVDEYDSEFSVNFNTYADKLISNAIEEALVRANSDAVIDSILEKAALIRKQEMSRNDINIEVGNATTTGEESKNNEIDNTANKPSPIPDISDKYIQISGQSLLSVKSGIKYRDRQTQVDKPIVLPVDDLLREKKDFQIPYDNLRIASKTYFDKQRRLSAYAKLVGDLSEKYVVKHLTETLTANQKLTLRWTAQEGYTPGWDIEYIDEHGKIVAIEVKGTTGYAFPNVELTGNEWEAAARLKEQYWIYLVSDVFNSPKLDRIQNPYYLNETNVLRVTPILWRVEMLSG